MKAIELQSKGEISNGEKLLYSNDYSNNGWNKLKSKKMILIISISIILIIAIVLIIVFTTRSSSNKNNTEKVPINTDKEIEKTDKEKEKDTDKEEDKEKEKDKDEDSEEIKKEYKERDFYSARTIAYYDLINNFEKENSILYHWNLEKDENNNVIFKNKYQHLYNYSTDLKPVNESIGYHLFYPENYRIIDTDLSNYYKAKEEKKPDHLIYGPSINGKEYAKDQSLYSDNIKLGNKNSKKGFSISFNIKKESNFGNTNSADFFGFNTKDKKGLSVSISWGVIYFRAGGYSNSYTYQDSVDLGYDEKDEYTKYLSFRPFYNNRWHHICIVQKILDEDDLLYIKDKKVGDVMGEFFFDGMSRKNFSVDLLNDYGNLTVFKFAEDDTKTTNNNFYIDEMMIFNKSLKKDEVKV